MEKRVRSKKGDGEEGKEEEDGIPLGLYVRLVDSYCAYEQQLNMFHEIYEELVLALNVECSLYPLTHLLKKQDREVNM